jgi:GxxExxY protein
MNADCDLPTRYTGSTMGSPHVGLKHHVTSDAILSVFYSAYNELGHDLLESVYEQSMAIALSHAGDHAGGQVPLRVWFRGHSVGNFRVDLIADHKVILELKTMRALELRKAIRVNPRESAAGVPA